MGVFKKVGREPICIKFGGDITRSSLHTKVKNGEDILLGFQITKAQAQAVLSDKAKNCTFDLPSVKIGEG